MEKGIRLKIQSVGISDKAVNRLKAITLFRAFKAVPTSGAFISAEPVRREIRDERERRSPG